MSLFLHQIWRNVALHHCLTNGSSAVNGCRQNERPNTDKNITIIHTTPVHQLTSWEDKSCVFVRNKSIIIVFLTSNRCFQLKYESIIHNAFFLSCLNQERNLHRSSTVYEPKQSKTALNKYVGGFWCERQQMIFTGGSVIMHYGLIFCLEVRTWNKKNLKWWICFFQTCIFSLLKTLTDGLEWCGLLWCFYQCLDSHSDGTHSLLSIHWWDTDAMLHFSKSDEETNSSTSWMSWGQVIFQ